MKCPKSDGLEQIIDKINSALGENMKDTNQASVSGAINRLTLQLIDLNKEAEY
jgi:hypothetical protein